MGIVSEMGKKSFMICAVTVYIVISSATASADIEADTSFEFRYDVAIE